MLLHLVAAGTRMPGWVNAGYREYADRLQGADYRMALTEVPLGRRSGEDVARAVAAEGDRMLAAAGPAAYVVALQVHGESWSTARLARWLDDRSREGDPLAFCIGGPDGLAATVDTRARLRWSLSSLTLPPGLARVVAAEALYRAVSLIKGLPYHRA
jgi:23S rRNA (pseudouridine1915-N3)-methyltransferase